MYQVLKSKRKYSKIKCVEKKKWRKTMEEEKRKAYSEVVEILKLIEDEKALEAIPFEVIELIKKNADPTYRPNISKEIPIEEQNLRNETYSIMGWIANKYWGQEIGNENIEESQKVEENSQVEHIEAVQENAQDSIQEKTNNNTEQIENTEKVNMKKDKEVSVYNDIEPECLEGSNLPMLVDIKWYQRLKNQVIKIIRKLFRIKSKEEVIE